jgi:hypothetical protein
MAKPIPVTPPDRDLPLKHLGHARTPLHGASGHQAPPHRAIGAWLSYGWVTVKLSNSASAVLFACVLVSTSRPM